MFTVVQTPDIAYQKPASGFVLEEEKADAVSESAAVQTDVGCEKPAGGRSAVWPFAKASKTAASKILYVRFCSIARSLPGYTSYPNSGSWGLENLPR